MPQQNSFDPTNPPPLGQRRCPVCGVPMFMARIEPTDEDGKDRRTFECVSCGLKNHLGQVRLEPRNYSPLPGFHVLLRYPRLQH